MKSCAYCTAENRDEAIFCNRCRRPLPSAPRPPRIILVWLLMVIFLVGFGSYLFLSRPLPEAAPAAMSTSTGMAVAGPAPTRTQEPLAARACVGETAIRIRRGPATSSETIGGLIAGTCLTILGRTQDASWVYIVSEDQQTGWVAVLLLPDAGDINRVSVRDDTILANPARPTLTSAEIANGAQVYLTAVASTNIPRSPLTRYVVPCFGTANRIGDEVSCRMERAYCDYLPDLEGSPTICNDRPAPDHAFALVVFGEDWSEYDAQCLIVSGYLEIDRGALQIRASRRAQVSYCE